jgi:hypothetical protein
MPGDLENTLRAAAERIVSYVEDAARMTVETKFVRPATADGSVEQPLLLARTMLSLDGDSEAVVPMRQGEGGDLRVDLEALEVHRANVRTAIEYRARMLNTLLLALQARPRGGGE